MLGYMRFPLAISQHDIGIREIAALSGRAAYVLMCFTLCWGILTATGWVRRLSGHQAVRTGHVMLAALTLAAGVTHAVVFLLLQEQVFSVAGLIVPFGGPLRHEIGVLGLELMIAITIATGLRRWVNYRRWLRFHQLAYAAVALAAAHAWLGAIANGHLSVLWLSGVTVIVPACTLTALRVLPPRFLMRAGLLGAAPVVGPRPEESAKAPSRAAAAADGATAVAVDRKVDRAVLVSVDNQRCKRYGICQAEAPQLFKLLEDGRLRYVKGPRPSDHGAAQAAARACPVRAIQLQEVRDP